MAATYFLKQWIPVLYSSISLTFCSWLQQIYDQGFKVGLLFTCENWNPNPYIKSIPCKVKLSEIVTLRFPKSVNTKSFTSCKFNHLLPFKSMLTKSVTQLMAVFHIEVNWLCLGCVKHYLIFFLFSRVHWFQIFWRLHCLISGISEHKTQHSCFYSCSQLTAVLNAVNYFIILI